jgi:tRNA A37 threonylcarbamoyladenosine synthetase subunit TsaC/SUA5/YrdC
MPVLNPQADAQRAMEVMQDGGIAILPNDVGYSLIAATSPALQKIFRTKRRAPQKLNAMLGNDDLHRELHVVSERGKSIVEAITQDYDLPLGLVAPCRSDHPLLRSLDQTPMNAAPKTTRCSCCLTRGHFIARSLA